MSDSSKKTVRAATLMMLITLVGKILGLVRETLLAANYGMSMQAYAFQTASRIPRVFFDAIFASAISASFIPIFNESLEKDGRDRAFEFSDRFITLIIIITTLLTIAGMGFAPQLTRLFSPGFDTQTAGLSSELLKIMFPTVVFTGVAYSFVGILQSFDEFTIPAAMSIVSNGIIIIYYYFFNGSFGIVGLSVALLAGWAMQAFMQIPSLRKKGYKYRPRLGIAKDGSIKRVIVLMLPVMVSTWVQPINIAINSRFASHLYDGAGVSAIDYANNLYTIIAGVFILSVANVIFPRLSRMTANNDKSSVFSTVVMTIRILSFIIIPMTAGIMALSPQIINVIYQRGDFTAADTVITSGALFYFSLGMFGYGLQIIISRAFYAEQDGKTPFIAGLISIIVNAVMCRMLVDKMSVSGLALASAVSSTIYGLVLYILLKRKFKADTKGLGISVIKMVVCSAVMAVIVVFIRDVLWNANAGMPLRILFIAAAVVAGMVVYAVMCKITRLYELSLAWDFVKNIRKTEDK